MLILTILLISLNFLNCKSNSNVFLSKNPVNDGCTETNNLPIFGPDESILEGDYKGLIDYMKGMINVIKTESLTNILHVFNVSCNYVQDPKITEECLKNASNKLEQNFEKLVDHLYKNNKQIEKLIEEKADPETHKDFNSYNGILHKAIRWSFYSYEVAFMLRVCVSSTYNAVTTRCMKVEEPGIFALIEKFDSMIFKSCKKAKCLSRIVKLLSKADNSIKDLYLKRLSLFAIDLQRSLIFCASTVNNEPNANRQIFEKASNMILDAIEGAKRVLEGNDVVKLM